MTRGKTEITFPWAITNTTIIPEKRKKKKKHLSTTTNLISPNGYNALRPEMLGCFSERMQPLALKRPPQHPSVIKTQFYLYTREKRKDPDRLEYGDELESMNQASFNASKKLRVIIHGFKGSGNNEEAIAGAHAFLDLVSQLSKITFSEDVILLARFGYVLCRGFFNNAFITDGRYAEKNGCPNQEDRFQSV